MDLTAKGSFTTMSEEMEEGSDSKKSCTDCNTTKTPLWRSGPTGPKTLCNACGIKYRKRSRPTVGLNKRPEKKKEKPPSPSSPTTTAAVAPIVAANDNCNRCEKDEKGNSKGNGPRGADRVGKDGQLRNVLRLKLVSLGKEVVLLQRPRSPMKRQRSRRKMMGEVERAALLLMSLSCGSVFG